MRKAKIYNSYILKTFNYSNFYAIRKPTSIFTFKRERLQDKLLVGQSHQRYVYIVATRCGLVRCHFAEYIGKLTIQPFFLWRRIY